MRGLQALLHDKQMLSICTSFAEFRMNLFASYLRMQDTKT